MIMTTDAVVFIAVNKNKCEFDMLPFLLSVSNLISLLLLPFSLFSSFPILSCFPNMKYGVIVLVIFLYM